MPHQHNLRHLASRRDVLQSVGAGFGMLALHGLVSDTTAAVVHRRTTNPLAELPAHHPATAKRCIFIYLPGGPSQIDLFDPKPEVSRRQGQPLPFQMPTLVRTRTNNLHGTPFSFRKHGQSGISVSELLPNLAGCVDDICVIRSMVADNINHGGAALQMHTGEQAFSRPSVGSWATYGLGSQNENLPGFVVISPKPTFQSGPLFSSSFLPAAYQGTLIRDLNNPIADLKSKPHSQRRQRAQIAALRRLHELRRDRLGHVAALDARIASFELAYRMQVEAPEAFEIERESAHTLEQYGIGNPETEPIGKQLLLARRLAERGVRFIQVFDSSRGNNAWDHHNQISSKLPVNCRQTDLPIAGFLQDLKRRGLLEETLVVWGGEFGRTPTAEGADGREHHPFGFTMWLAGGGIKGGHVHGSTDDFGWHAVRDKVHIHDLHATILHTLGLNHETLTFRYGGRDYRLTDVFGRVVQEILA
ncbi:MAG TPA: DUF1501 domain-containing protein [Planctomycetaceae bacterium]|nr:DUF1501 domain-containing protein [Planctomycetaceae bacterium]